MNAAEREAKKLQLQRMKREFVNEYLVDFDAKRAAAMAGFMSESRWSRLLNDPFVDRLVNERLAVRRKSCEIDGAMVLRETAGIAFASAGDYFHVDWRVKRPEELTDMQRRAIEAVQVEETVDDEGRTVRKVKFKLHSKIAALEMLGKNLRLFSERVELNLTDGLAERLAEAKARLANTEVVEPKMLEAGR